MSQQSQAKLEEWLNDAVNLVTEVGKENPTSLSLPFTRKIIKMLQGKVRSSKVNITNEQLASLENLMNELTTSVKDENVSKLERITSSFADVLT